MRTYHLTPITVSVPKTCWVKGLSFDIRAHRHINTAAIYNLIYCFGGLDWYVNGTYMFINHRIQNILISNLIDVLLATSVFYYIFFAPHRPSTEINQCRSVASFSHCPFGWMFHPYRVSLKLLNRYPASMGDWFVSILYSNRSSRSKRMVILYLIPFDSTYGATLAHAWLSNAYERKRESMLVDFICGAESWTTFFDSRNEYLVSN